MAMPTVKGFKKIEITRLLSIKSSFEITGLRGNFTKAIKSLEKEVECLGFKCRVKSDIKGAITQGGILGAVIGIASLPIGIALATTATVASTGHTLATYNPDYEIIKDYINKKLKVIYKK